MKCPQIVGMSEFCLLSNFTASAGISLVLEILYRNTTFII